MEYEVIIVGGGFAGLTAAIFASERGLKTLLISKNLGGQILLADKVTNYPGIKEISGVELIQKTLEQVKERNVEIKIEEVKGFEEKDGNYIVKTDKGEYLTKSIIIASGKIPRKLNIPGEDNFSGKFVHYSFIPSVEEVKGKIVAVVGGGNTALEVALRASKYANKVYLIHRRDKFRGFESLVEKVKGTENIEVLFNSVLKEIVGNEKIEKLVLKKTKVEEGKVIETEEKFEIRADYVIICIGFVPSSSIYKDFVKTNELGMIITDKLCQTFDPETGKIKKGVFAAGDVTDTPFKQLTVAAGEGTKAALQAYLYIKGRKIEGIFGSWHTS